MAKRTRKKKVKPVTDEVLNWATDEEIQNGTGGHELKTAPDESEDLSDESDDDSDDDGDDD